MLRPTKAHNEHSPLTLLKLESGGYYTLLELTLTDELYEKKLTNQQLHAAISQLPEKQAKRIYAYYFLDMDEPTIARTEGVSHQAVHSSIQHGLKRIEKILKNSF